MEIFIFYLLIAIPTSIYFLFVLGAKADTANRKAARRARKEECKLLKW